MWQDVAPLSRLLAGPTRGSLANPVDLAINFSWLNRLRWGAILGQTLTVFIVDRWMAIHVPLVPLFGIIAIEALFNVSCTFWQNRRQVGERAIAVSLAFDVAFLTGLLFLSGGPFNPFSFLYLVHIALAAVVLSPRWTWALVILSLACFGFLFVDHVWLPLDFAPERQFDHMRMHLRGMWVAFGVAAWFIVYFVQRVRRTLAQRDAELAKAREEKVRTERLASLATLAAGAAHELSTPLSTIAVAAKELERALPGEDSDAVADAQLIRREVERCREILTRMAADAGGSAGEAIVSCSPADLVTTAVDGLAARERIRIEVENSDRRTNVSVPHRAVERALSGVIKNALEASSTAEVTVRVFALAGQCRISVEDRGPGMPPEVLRRVGEPFFTTKPPGHGMGLGLFLARSLVESLGGTLEITSATEQGTTVLLTLPTDTAASLAREVS